jgi:hypothetical protein
VEVCRLAKKLASLAAVVVRGMAMGQVENSALGLASAFLGLAPRGYTGIAQASAAAPLKRWEMSDLHENCLVAFP